VETGKGNADPDEVSPPPSKARYRISHHRGKLTDSGGCCRGPWEEPRRLREEDHSYSSLVISRPRRSTREERLHYRGWLLSNQSTNDTPEAMSWCSRYGVLPIVQRSAALNLLFPSRPLQITNANSTQNLQDSGRDPGNYTQAGHFSGSGEGLFDTVPDSLQNLQDSGRDPGNYTHAGHFSGFEVGGFFWSGAGADARGFVVDYCCPSSRVDGSFAAIVSSGRRGRRTRRPR